MSAQMERVRRAREVWEQAQFEAARAKRLWGVSSPHMAREAQERADMAEAELRRVVA